MFMEFKILIICSKIELYKGYRETLTVKFDNESIYLNIYIYIKKTK